MLKENYSASAQKIIDDWKKDGYECVAISSKNGECYPLDKSILPDAVDFAFTSFTGYHTPNSIGGDLFFPIDAKEIKAALVKSLMNGVK